MGSRRGPRGSPALGGNSDWWRGSLDLHLPHVRCRLSRSRGGVGRVEIRPERRAGPPGQELRPQPSSSPFHPAPHPPPESWMAGSLWSWMWARKGMPTGPRFRRCCTASSPVAPSPPTSPLPRDSSSDAWAQVSPSWSRGRPPPVSQTHVRPLPAFSVPTMGPPSLAFHTGSDGELTTL